MIAGELWLNNDDVPTYDNTLGLVILLQHIHGKNLSRIIRVRVCHPDDLKFYDEYYTKAYCYHNPSLYVASFYNQSGLVRLMSLHRLKPCDTKDAAFYVTNDEYFRKASQAVRKYITAGLADTVEVVFDE